MGEFIRKNTSKKVKPEISEMQVVERAAVIGEDADRYAMRDAIEYVDLGKGGIEEAAVNAAEKQFKKNYALVPFTEVRGKVKVGDEELVVRSAPPKILFFHGKPLTEVGVVFINGTVHTDVEARRIDPAVVWNSGLENGKFVQTPDKKLMPFREDKDRIIQVPREQK